MTVYLYKSEKGLYRMSLSYGQCKIYTLLVINIAS